MITFQTVKKITSLTHAACDHIWTSVQINCIHK